MWILKHSTVSALWCRTAPLVPKNVISDSCGIISESSAPEKSLKRNYSVWLHFRTVIRFFCKEKIHWLFSCAGISSQAAASTGRWTSRKASQWDIGGMDGCGKNINWQIEWNIRHVLWCDCDGFAVAKMVFTSVYCLLGLALISMGISLSSEQVLPT